MMRKILLLLILIVLSSGCASNPSAAEVSGGVGSIPVFVISHGRHTGFIIPSAPIQNKIPELSTRFGSVEYLEFGWGDKDFYQSQDPGLWLTVKAVLWPTESVMHVVAVPENPYDYFTGSEIIRLCLSDDQFSSLVSFIESGFQRTADGEITALVRGRYGNSQFYQGEGSYFMTNTCNTWTAEGLEVMGMDIYPAFKLTADSVMDYLVHSGMGCR